MTTTAGGEITTATGGNQPKSRRRMVPSWLLPTDYEPLRDLVKHHIESFDFMVEKGLEDMLMAIKPVEVFDSFSKKKLRNILHFESNLLASILFVFL